MLTSVWEKIARLLTLQGNKKGLRKYSTNGRQISHLQVMDLINIICMALKGHSMNQPCSSEGPVSILVTALCLSFSF